MASVWKTAGMGAAAGLAVPVAGLSGLAATALTLILVLAMVGVGPARLSQTSLWVSVITGFDVVMVTLRDGELPHERRSALLLEREGALHSGVFKAMPFGCGLRPQP